MASEGHRPAVWVLEPSVFADGHGALDGAIKDAGHRVLLWKDEWWDCKGWPDLPESTVVFYGSLGNAHRVREQLPWRPGAFCNTAAFFCSAWYPRASRWLLNREFRILPAEDLVRDPSSVLQELGNPSTVFVRPDSPLKPFSGRVLPSDGVTLKALDHGYYYEDASLPVLVSPGRAVGAEWRFVVADRQVVAGCHYASDRTALAPEVPGTKSWSMAAEVAANMEPPEPVYVLDLCESDGSLRLLELNPFSGADLYACDMASVVAAVTRSANLTGPRQP